ncbi:hypothetical protein PHYPSEUDO_014312 [Phytophthora pseudosyringae]|uniref:Uncharacterized protein n=1 Tax=Phytophthora pseudosyringae TaxID=221518 RepID=A0A8T1WHV3_9STRA|nr:hypothetical protein PHYPSEUDO_014312 [Phytophthora pseudosyringae]
MAKKSGGLKSKGNAGKKAGGSKPKKAGMFKALKKQEKRAGVVGADKNEPHSNRRKAKVTKRPAPVSDEFRNFDERMAAKNTRRPGLVSKAAAVAAPTFVMAAPTFQFDANPVQPMPAPREVEGFHGFMSALETPKDSPAVNTNQTARQARPVLPEYRGSNVFAVLDNGDEEQLKPQRAPQPAPAFMQPATFTFATAKPTFTLPSSSLQSSLRQSMHPVAGNAMRAEDIDPDL